MDQQSSEYKSLLKFSADLSRLLQHNVVTVSARLLEKGLVTKDVHDWILTTDGVSGQKNASRLVSCVLDRIKHSTRCFQVFIDVLRDDPYFEDIVERILAVHIERVHHPDSCDDSVDCDENKQAVERSVCSTSSDVTMERDENKHVGHQIKKLDKSFTDLKKRLLTEMKANPDVTTETLLESLTWNLPFELRTVCKPYLDEKLPILEKLGTIREICSRLGLFFTFLDYHLLQYLVEEFGSEPLKQDMSTYAGEIQVFLDETTVQQVKDHLPGQHTLPPNFEKLKMVIDQNPGTYSLRMLDNLRKRFCSATQLSEVVFVLIGIGKANSFIIVFMVPSILGPRIVESVGGVDDSFYQTECITSILLNQQQLYLSVALRDKKAELERRLLALCIGNTGDIQEFTYILSQPGMDPNIYDENGVIPLCYVAYYGRTKVAEVFIDHGAKIDLPNKDKLGGTPLTLASQEGHVATCAVLIERGATVNYQTKQRCTALYLAAYSGHKEVVELLLDKGATVDQPNATHGSTALLVACEYGQTAVAHVLIARGAAVNHQDEEGNTPLMAASYKGHKEVALLLLHSGTLPDIPDKNTSTPLTMACEKGYEDLSRLLIKHGAAINYQEKDGLSPLHYASAHDHPRLVELLTTSGAQLDIQTKDGWTALMWAAYKGYKQIVSILLTAGAKPDVQNKDGLTAHDVASINSHPAVCQLLEQCGYKPSHPLPALVPPQVTSRHDPVTSLQTFRNILEHGSKLFEAPTKQQASHNAPEEHDAVL